MVTAMRLYVIRDVGLHQKEFVAHKSAVRLLEADSALADRFDFAAPKHNAGFELFENFVIEASLAVSFEDLIGLRVWSGFCHGGTRARVSPEVCRLPRRGCILRIWR